MMQVDNYEQENEIRKVIAHNCRGRKNYGIETCVYVCDIQKIMSDSYKRFAQVASE